ncbi:hypothetical protein ACT3CE_12815 [Marinifilum sp. RC60d5]
MACIPNEAGSFNLALEVSDNKLSETQEFVIEVGISTGINDVFAEPEVSI